MASLASASSPSQTSVDSVLEEHAVGWRAHLPQFRDPGRASLRRAARAALLVPALFAAASVLTGSPQLVTFASFGAFALGVMGDFGGASRRRAMAYAVTTAVGCLVVSIGTFASQTAWIAAGVVLVCGFVLQFAGVFGGYATAAQLPLMLSLVLSIAIPVPPEALPQRLVGWIVGGAVALLGGVFLWPRHEQRSLSSAAAEACSSLADLVRARYGTPPTWPAVENDSRRALTLFAALRQAYATTPHRPASPSRQDRAFAELVDEIGRAEKFIAAFSSPEQQSAPAPAAPEASADLAETVADTLRASAAVLVDNGPPPDLARLAEGRDVQGHALDEWTATELRRGTPANVVLDRLEAIRSLRVVSYVAVAIAANATLAAGQELTVELLSMPPEVEATGGVRAGWERLVRAVGTHLRPSSIWSRNSLRAAVAIALAVLIVNRIGLDHAFWAVLGTLSVLRTNALATGRTALAAVVGTSLGILPASLILIPLGTDARVLWAMLPVSVFLAAYAPSVIGFVVGQAAFTLLVMVLFNLIQPVGWTLGLVRLEDVLVGAGLSLGVGALFWPRGARGHLRTALGSLYRRNAAYLHAASGLIFGHSSLEDCLAARRAVIGEAARAGEVFDQFLIDRAAKILPMATWAALQAGGSHLILAGDALERMGASGSRVSQSSPGAQVLARATDALVKDLDCLGASLEDGRVSESSPGSEVTEQEVWQAAADNLAAWGGTDNEERRHTALAMVAVSDWIHYLRLLINHLSGPATAVVRVASSPWSY